MTVDSVFHDAKTLIKDILIILNFQYKYLHNREYKSDWQPGIVKKNNIYLPLSSINHRILFDGYETTLLEIYIELYKRLFEKWDETFAQFALRTLEELSFEKIQILFDKNIASNKKNKYKLLIWLADYASLSVTKENEVTYLKLLNDHKQHLTDGEYTFYSSLLAQMKNLQPVDRYKLIKNARKRINPLQQDLVASTKTLPFIREINILALSSSYSHILHGNVLLLKDILQLKREHAQQLRIYWFLLLTGVNVINRIGVYLDDAKLNKEITEINSNFVIFSTYIRDHWEEILKDK
jgi:hypothetical protein